MVHRASGVVKLEGISTEYPRKKLNRTDQVLVRKITPPVVKRSHFILEFFRFNAGGDWFICSSPYEEHKSAAC